MKRYRYKKSYKTKKKISIFNILKIILKNKFFWFGFLFFIILSGLVYLFIFSSIFQIKNIQVSGTEKTYAEKIRNIIEENSRNIFLINLEKINKIILEKYIQIANLDIKKKFPDKLLVEVQERKPIAILCHNDCFFIDNQGKPFEKVFDFLPELLIIKAQEISQEQVDQILEINYKLKNVIQISEVSLISENRLNVKTLDGWQIYFNSKGDLNWQIEELMIILKEKILSEDRKNLEYIDLRFEKVYIKERSLTP